MMKLRGVLSGIIVFILLIEYVDSIPVTEENQSLEKDILEAYQSPEDRFFTKVKYYFSFHL